MRWGCVINNWKTGKHPRLPKYIKKPFIWRTSVINCDIDLNYKDEFIENDNLIQHQDLSTFYNYFDTKEKYTIGFPNLSGDTYLIIPIPRKGKEFTNLFYFMKNASNRHQQEFWKIVAIEIENFLYKKKHKNLWISSHGFGVNYLHIRICTYPKYYGDSKLIKYKN